MMSSPQATAPTSTASDATIFLDLFNFLMPAGANDTAAPVMADTAAAAMAGTAAAAMAGTAAAATADTAAAATADTTAAATADPAAAVTAAIASPKQIAGALIRSMLGMKTKSATDQAGSAADSNGGTKDAQPRQRNRGEALDPSALIPGPVAVPSLPAWQAGDPLTNVLSKAAVPAEPMATALLALNQAAPQSPLAFGARLVKTDSNQNTNPEPATPATPAPAPGASSLPVMPIAKYEPARRDPQGTPAPTPLAADSPASQAIPAMMLAAVSDHAGPSGTRVADAAPQPAAEALRASEPAQPAATPSAGPAQEIVLRVAPPESSPVDVQVTQHAGEVHVAVRTADPALQTALRQDLPSLVNSLERAGYHAETFTPQEMTAQAAAASSGSSFNDQQQDAQPDSPDRNLPDPSNGRQQEQRQRDRQQQNWLDEMEK
jgi:hypothetical protein